MRFDREHYFENEWERVRKSPERRQLFLDACEEFRQAIRRLESGEVRGLPPFPAHLRVHHIANGIWSMTWAGDGRATWRYGDSEWVGEVLIWWRRIGGHEIYNDP